MTAGIIAVCFAGFLLVTALVIVIVFRKASGDEGEAAAAIVIGAVVLAGILLCGGLGSIHVAEAPPPETGKHR